MNDLAPNTRSIATTSEIPWSKPRWLENWRAEMPIPVNPTEVSRALQGVENALRPIGPKEAAALLAQTVEVFGVPQNWDKIADVYLEALEDVPRDLAVLAMKRVRLNLKFFPKPAEIRAQIAPELSERNTVRARLSHALWRTNRSIG
jgi:hypothetical protein